MSSDGMRFYENILETVGKTPLVHLSRISRGLPVPLYAPVDDSPPAAMGLHLACDRDEERADLGGRQAQAVVRHRACHGVGRLHDVKAVDSNLPPQGECAARLHGIWTASEEIAVEG